uniref:Prominin-1-A-like n=1 Tax=Sinocyclocheilus grahami TaxID=75366 RepID=A0A672R8D6_SINGR
MRSRMKGVFWSGILPLFLWTLVSGQPSCPIDTNRTELQTPHEIPTKLTFNSAFMSPIVHSFLGSVQPNPFPKGFLVCVAIGILYIVLMPLIGLIFACCRCCGNCGGRMQQKQTTNIHCKRRSFYLATFLITVLILAGNVCMFLSSTNTSETVMRSPTELTDILENVKGYLNTISKQIEQVESESNVTVDTVKSNLNGSLLGKLIQNGLKGPLDPALNSITEIAQVINSTSHELLKLNKTLELLKPKVDVLKANLSAVRQRINNTLHMPDCVNCTSQRPELDKLSLEGSLDVMTLCLVSFTVALLQLETLKTKISGVTKDLPLDVLKTISAPLTDVQKSIKAFSPDIERSSKISRAVGLVLSCLILLVVICNFLGLLLGVAGQNSKDNPIERSGTSNCGGIFFMAGVGFSFLVSWIFMLVVLILFIVGGNTYTLVCKPWQNKELIQIIDTPGLIPGFNLSRSLNLNTNLNIANVYSDCQKNKPLWTTFHLNKIFDLNSKLNVSQTFDGVQINIANITILSPKVKSQLNNFSNSASSMNFSNITQQVHYILHSQKHTSIYCLMDQIHFFCVFQSNQAIKDELHGEAKDLRDIQTDITSNIMPLLLLYASFLQESRAFIDCQLKIFQTFIQWTNQTITERVGRCGPAAAAVDRSEELICKHLVESLNAFWLSLGWCMMFLIPSIIFSVKLAKYYRRMKYSDVYENNNFMMNPFPKAHLKPELLENGKQPPFT